MFFSLLVTPILPVSSPLLLISLTLDCKLCTEMLVFSMFQREQSSTMLAFQKWNIKKKKRNIENLTQIQYIVVQYFDPNSQLFHNFINLLSIYTYFNGNQQIKTKKILNACKNKTFHANTLQSRIIGGVGIIGGLDGVEKIVQGVSQYLYVKLNKTLYSFFSTNGYIFPIQVNTRKLRNDGI